jgi:hypothetical protein
VSGTCSTHGNGRSVHRVLVGRPEGKENWEDLGVGGKKTLRCTLGG